MEVKNDKEPKQLDDQTEKNGKTMQTILEQSNKIQQQVADLCLKVECLQLESQTPDQDQQNELQRVTDSLQHVCILLQEQMASITTIQNIQFDEFTKRLLENDKMRLQLLADLKTQEESHLHEVQQLKMQLKAELEAKDTQCLKLEQEIERSKVKDDIDISCSICLEQWNSSSDHRLVSLRCGHLFGDKCIRSHLRINNECPQCRARAQDNEIRCLYGRPM